MNNQETKHEEISIETLSNVLGKTIKNDDSNKILTFLCMLSAFTDNSQFNISFNSPSSTGKSYIPTEVAKLFPEEDLIELGYCSPMAFFHKVGDSSTNKDEYKVDLSRKIIVFLDQPHNDLLARLRPLLSHDKKEIKSLIADRKQKSGLRSKDISILGFPSVVFCTTSSRIDEQESTRFFLLSPEVNQSKLENSLENTIRFESLGTEYQNDVYLDGDYLELKNRVRDIRDEKIDNIVIRDTELIQKKFRELNGFLKPRHNRDIKRLISVIKSLALLNMWSRERSDDSKTIYVNNDDIDKGFEIWNKVNENQEIGIPPYVLNIFKDIIYSLCLNKGLDNGITRQEIMKEYFKYYNRTISEYSLRIEVIPVLETASLIRQEQDPENRTRKLIFVDPTYQDPLMSKLKRLAK